ALERGNARRWRGLLRRIAAPAGSLEPCRRCGGRRKLPPGRPPPPRAPGGGAEAPFRRGAPPRFRPRPPPPTAPLRPHASRALAARDLGALGPVLEEEALNLHRIAETSTLPVRYGTDGTDAVVRRVRTLRNEGLNAWFTLDAGPNVHVITAFEDAAAVESALA